MVCSKLLAVPRGSTATRCSGCGATRT
ncbi:hypothetical protein EI534_32185 [Pseudomonas frederiksbergensis]|nr:hypothetical protein [Pseudomonas donghuensis]MCE6981925.1 hypothetical protein [Pseudomonas frederiksbergensis]